MKKYVIILRHPIIFMKAFLYGVKATGLDIENYGYADKDRIMNSEETKRIIEELSNRIK